MADKMTVSDFSTCPGTDHTPSGPKTNSYERQGEQVPEGGVQAWATVAGGFMLYVAGLG
jgi:hypothetical protein